MGKINSRTENSLKLCFSCKFINIFELDEKFTSKDFELISLTCSEYAA